MRKPTKVTTKTKTSDRASRRKAIAGFNPPASNQVQRVAVRTPPVGGEVRKRAARRIASAAETPTEPVPIAAAKRLGIVRPRIARTANPASGRTGMSQRIVAMSALHRSGGVGIERFEMTADLD